MNENEIGKIIKDDHTKTRSTQRIRNEIRIKIKLCAFLCVLVALCEKIKLCVRKFVRRFMHLTIIVQRLYFKMQEERRKGEDGETEKNIHCKLQN